MSQLYQENFPYVTPAWSRIFNFVADRAEGAYIYTDDGKKLLDFTSGIGVTNTGHCHPDIVAAVKEQDSVLELNLYCSLLIFIS